MEHNWQALISDAHTTAFRIALMPAGISERLHRLVYQALNSGMTSSEFCYLSEMERKNGN